MKRGHFQREIQKNLGEIVTSKVLKDMKDTTAKDFLLFVQGEKEVL